MTLSRNRQTPFVSCSSFYCDSSLSLFFQALSWRVDGLARSQSFNQNYALICSPKKWFFSWNCDFEFLAEREKVKPLLRLSFGFMRVVDNSSFVSSKNWGKRSICDRDELHSRFSSQVIQVEDRQLWLMTRLGWRHGFSTWRKTESAFSARDWNEIMWLVNEKKTILSDRRWLGREGYPKI